MPLPMTMWNSFLKEARGQGPALRAMTEHFRGAGAADLRRAAESAGARPLLICGMGSSWAAALALEAYLVQRGRLAVAIEASEALYRWPR